VGGPRALFEKLETLKDCSVLIIMKDGTRVTGKLSKVSEGSSLVFLEDCIVTRNEMDHAFPWFLIKTHNLMGVAPIGRPLDLANFKRFLEGNGLREVELRAGYLSIENDSWRVYADRRIVSNHEMHARLAGLLERFTRAEGRVQLV